MTNDQGRKEKESQRLIRDLEDQVRQTLVDMGVPVEIAEVAGRGVGRMVRADWGGLQIYIPKSWSDDAAAIREQVRKAAEVPGATPGEICRKFKISARKYYRILHEQ